MEEKLTAATFGSLRDEGQELLQGEEQLTAANLGGLQWEGQELLQGWRSS